MGFPKFFFFFGKRTERDGYGRKLKVAGTDALLLLGGQRVRINVMPCKGRVLWLRSWVGKAPLLADADADAHAVYARVCSSHELSSACDIFSPLKEENYILLCKS